MNRKIILGTFLIIILLIGGFTTYKVIKGHNDRLLLVSEKYIIEKAKKCYDRKICVNDIVTLKELYDLEFLDIQVNPVTKEYYKDLSYIKKEENNYSFIIVN